MNSFNLDCLHRLRMLQHRQDQFRIAFPERGIVDFGVHVRGGLQAGLELARICLGQAGAVSFASGEWGPRVQVFTDQPGLACMGSQYGGWPVQMGDYFAIGSGPMRLHRGREKVLTQYGWQVNPGPVAVGVLESAQLPAQEVRHQMARECNIDPVHLYLCVAPTRSLAGTAQVVARSIEATLHKLFELQFDLTSITSAFGTAPLPPVSENDMTAIGRTNDAILYGADVRLWVDWSDQQIQEVGPQTPSRSSPEFGQPFAEIFRRSGGDFYKLDPMLFSAARVSFVSNLSGRTFVFGGLESDIVRRSFQEC